MFLGESTESGAKRRASDGAAMLRVTVADARDPALDGVARLAATHHRLSGRPAKRLIELLVGVGRARRAVTAVEYAIIAGVLAVVIVASVTAIGPDLAKIFNKVATPL